MLFKKHLLAFLAIPALIALIYSNTINAAFHYDDFFVIVTNPLVQIKEFSLRWLFEILSLRRPVAHLTFALNYYFDGLNVASYHLINIIIHIIAGISLYLFLYEALMLHGKGIHQKRALWIALLSSLLWASNPVQTQAVTYIVQRMASMASMFYVLSLLFYIKGRVSSGLRRWTYWFFTATSFLLSYGSKQIGFTLPILLVIYELCIFQRSNIRGIFKARRSYSIAATIFLVAMATFLFKIIYTYLLPISGYALKERIYTQSRVIIHYLTLLIFPLPERMSLHYDYPLSRTLFMPVTTGFSLTTLSFLLVYAVIGIKKHPLLSFLILWFMITITPEAVVPLQLVFEHRLYLPSMAFFSIIVLTGFSMFEKCTVLAKKALLFSAIAVIIAFSINTYKRNSLWIDGYSIYADSVRKYPYSVEARLSLGTYYLNAGMYDEAITHLTEAIKIHPRRPDAYRQLGIAYSKSGEHDNAIKALRRASDLGELTFEVFAAMGNSYMFNGNLEGAEYAYNEAIKRAPDNELRQQAIAALRAVREEKTGKEWVSE